MRKKLVAVLLAGVMALALAACGGSSSSGSAAPAEEGKTADQGAPAGGGDGTYAVDVIVKTTASEYWGYVVAGVNAYGKPMIWVTRL